MSQNFNFSTFWTFELFEPFEHIVRLLKRKTISLLTNGLTKI